VSGLVLSGSFEAPASLAEWSYGGNLSVTHAVTGTHSLLLGLPVTPTEQGEGQAWANQTIYVTPTWARPTLSFAYNMHVNDILDYSDFFVEIQDGMGLNHLATVIRAGYRSCVSETDAPPPQTDLDWRTMSVDLSVFKGQSIRIVFWNRNLWPRSLGIWTYVDNVRVVDAGALPSHKVYLPVLTGYRCDPGRTSALMKADPTTRFTRPR
jgi:hypothetical protein